MAEWDCSNYSIPELEEALGTVDGRRYPENKAALERELKARKASGEYQRFMEAGHMKAKQERTSKIRIDETKSDGPLKRLFGLLVIATASSICVTGLLAFLSLLGDGDWRRLAADWKIHAANAVLVFLTLFFLMLVIDVVEHLLKRRYPEQMRKFYEEKARRKQRRLSGRREE